MFDKTDLIQIISTLMPWGKYKGRVILDLPEEYLLWMQRKGWPPGRLGQLLALTLEIKIHGGEEVLAPLRRQVQPQTPSTTTH